MPTRWAAYAGASTTLAAGVILKALHQRPNFYSASVYLAQSNANLMILTNFVFLCVCAVLLALQKLLYGPLRPIEIEQLYEKAWFAVTETCLAMTIFPRGELGGWFLVMFFSLLAGKVWGWIGEGRVEFLEQQPPSNPRLFHTRLAVSLSLAILFNSYLLEYSIRTVLHQARPDMMVMFGFEFAVLTITSTSTALRYGISLAEIYIVRKQKTEVLQERQQELRRQRESAAGADSAVSVPQNEEIDELELDVPGWEEKGRWIFYLDLATDFLKLNVYLAFFTILLTFYGLPIHIIRDVFFTCRSFINRIKDFMRYRTATRDMNEKYPDATADEVAGADVCIICREEMSPWPPQADAHADGQAGAETRQRMRNNVAERMRPKKLPCGHVLHFSCLRSWLERQQNCPTCRRPVLEAPRRTGQEGGPGVNAAGHEGQPPQPNGNGGGRNRPNGIRIRNFGFGPLQIGVGAVRMNNAAQEGNDGDLGGNDAGIAGGPNQYRFALGWNRGQARDQQRNSSESMQDQIRALEQRIQQQISELRVASDQLVLIQAMQRELERLRMTQTNTTSTGNPLSPLSGPRPFMMNNLPQPPQTLIGGNPSTVVRAGSSELPQGLVLPEGWSMQPLHRVDHGNRSQVNATSTMPSQPTNLQPTATSPSPPSNGTAQATPPNGSSASLASLLQPQPSRASPPATVTPELPSAPALSGNSSNISTSTRAESPQLPPTETRDPQATSGPVESAPESKNSASLPSWGFGNGQQSGPLPLSQAESSPSSRPVNSEADEEASTRTNGEHDPKGKGKAATVEDLVDDVD